MFIDRGLDQPNSAQTWEQFNEQADQYVNIFGTNFIKQLIDKDGNKIYINVPPTLVTVRQKRDK